MNIYRLREALKNARKSDSDIKKELEDPSFLSCMRNLLLDKEGLKKLLPADVAPLIDFFETSHVSQIKLFKLSSCIYLSIYLSIHLSISLSLSISIYLSIYLSIYISINLSIYQFIHLSVSMLANNLLTILYSLVFIYVYSNKLLKSKFNSIDSFNSNYLI